jgi:hypothetical protein
MEVSCRLLARCAVTTSYTATGPAYAQFYRCLPQFQIRMLLICHRPLITNYEHLFLCWCVRVFSPRFDWGLFPQRADMRAQLPKGGSRHPGLRENHVLRFPWILVEVVDTRHSVVEGLAEDVLLLLQVLLICVFCSVSHLDNRYIADMTKMLGLWARIGTVYSV